DEGPLGIERVADDREQRRPPLERLEELLRRLPLLAARVSEQVRGPADEDAQLVRAEQVGERRLQRLEERALDRAETLVLEAAPQTRRPELEPRELLVEVLGRPVDEPRVDRSVEA